ncbi:hypothetical protein [Nocardioides sp.]|uniref:hypothetical protein n=1 Tax=Nocardioides sp. TaxID=35761 RepID=UPI00260AADF1|nr:hypothetical protein [Nocardioides sp.]
MSESADGLLDQWLNRRGTPAADTVAAAQAAAEQAAADQAAAEQAAADQAAAARADEGRGAVDQTVAADVTAEADEAASTPGPEVEPDTESDPETEMDDEGGPVLPDDRTSHLADPSGRHDSLADLHTIEDELTRIANGTDPGTDPAMADLSTSAGGTSDQTPQASLGAEPVATVARVESVATAEADAVTAAEPDTAVAPSRVRGADASDAVRAAFAALDTPAAAEPTTPAVDTTTPDAEPPAIVVEPDVESDPETEMDDEGGPAGPEDVTHQETSAVEAEPHWASAETPAVDIEADTHAEPEPTAEMVEEGSPIDVTHPLASEEPSAPDTVPGAAPATVPEPSPDATPEPETEPATAPEPVPDEPETLPEPERLDPPDPAIDPSALAGLPPLSASTEAILAALTAASAPATAVAAAPAVTAVPRTAATAATSSTSGGSVASDAAAASAASGTATLTAPEPVAEPTPVAEAVQVTPPPAASPQPGRRRKLGRGRRWGRQQPADPTPAATTERSDTAGTAQPADPAAGTTERADLAAATATTDLAASTATAQAALADPATPGAPDALPDKADHTDLTTQDEQSDQQSLNDQRSDVPAESLSPETLPTEPTSADLASADMAPAEEQRTSAPVDLDDDLLTVPDDRVERVIQANAPAYHDRRSPAEIADSQGTRPAEYPDRLTARRTLLDDGPAEEHYFAPKRAGHRMLGVLLGLGLIATVAACWWAFSAKTLPAIGVAAVIGVATAIVWAARAGDAVTHLSTIGSRLVIERAGTRTQFDLADPHTPVTVHGAPTDHDWAVTFARRGMPSVVLDATVVDPVEFMEVFDSHRPQH